MPQQQQQNHPGVNKAEDFEIEELYYYSGGPGVATFLLENQKLLSGYKIRKGWAWENNHGDKDVNYEDGRREPWVKNIGSLS